MKMSEFKITNYIEQRNNDDQEWWVTQWMELINSYRFKKRLERAWNYAREGKVTSIQFEGRRVHGRVQGTEKKPYKVKLWLDVLDDENWEYVVEALANKAKWSAQLLAGVMPKDIENAFATTGKRLFPFNLQEIKSECTCPDQANPCKHVSAIFYLMGEQFRENPFILFQLRGRDKNRLLSDILQKRMSLEQENITIKETRNTNKTSLNNDGSNIQTTVRDINLWWSYTKNLDDDLVVITPAGKESVGPLIAGQLPLAKDPRFSNSHTNFIEHLISHAQTQGQKAMLQAMSVKHF